MGILGGKLVGQIWKPSTNGMPGIDRPIAELQSKGLSHAATYLGNASATSFSP
jgi:hypothetical protein